MAKTGSQLTANMARSGSGAPVPTSGTFTTTDVTGTPQTSPLSYTTGVITLVVPDNAVEVVLLPTTDGRVSEISDVSVYYFHTANTAQTYPCAKMQNMYFKRDAASGTLYFRFHIL